MPGTLYIVATPIGNLSDITLRALEILKSVDLILAEDTRVTSKLLKHYDIETSAKSYHQHSSEIKKLEILNDLLNGKNIALVTDAGTPGISDPGNELIDFLYRSSGLPSSDFLEGPDINRDSQKSSSANPLEIPVIPIPGPSSLTAAISVSGFDMSQYIFLGFMPKKKHSKIFERVKAAQMPFVYFDSPHRLIKNLVEIEKYFGDVEVFVARELTKMYEETYRGKVSEVLEKLSKSNPKGEVAVIVNQAS